MFTQFITILILVSIVGCILYGRRLIRTEKVDAVFGNPERAKGGAHWVIVGSSFLLLGERLYVMAPRPGRIHKEYKLPFAEMGLKEDLREIKKNKEFSSKREEILSMIWNMEEEIMGKDN